MTQQNARELVIKRESDSTPGTYEFVCGLRTRSWQVANAQVDTTVPDCADPSNPIVNTAKPGRQTLQFAGSGLFDNDAVMLTVVGDAKDQNTKNYQVIVPGYGTWQGPFMVADLEFSGEMDEQLAFSATWIPTDVSSLTFTAA